VNGSDYPEYCAEFIFEIRAGLVTSGWHRNNSSETRPYNLQNSNFVGMY